jgi:hypothetical protein
MRFAQRQSVLRSTGQRRFASEVAAAAPHSDKLPLPGQKLTGAANNAFNRERAAVKAHAAATSGQYKYPSAVKQLR